MSAQHDGHLPYCPFPLDIDDVRAVRRDVLTIVEGAIREVGVPLNIVKNKAGKVVRRTIPGDARARADAEVAKALRLAFDRFGVPYEMVTKAEYRRRLVEAFPKSYKGCPLPLARRWWEKEYAGA